MLRGNQAGRDAQAPTTFTPPSISLPKGGGAIRGIGETFAANPVTGTGSMAIPLGISPGRSAFGPLLSLSYDSGTGNGPFGAGWSLPIPSITRKTEKGLPQYRDTEESDVFILSGVEDLVPTLVEIDGQWQRETSERMLDGVRHRVLGYRPRIEGLFARIERWTDSTDGTSHWRSISRDNVITLYGRTSESRIADPEDPTRIFKWLICETRDDAGNLGVYEYKEENSDGVDLTQVHERNRTASTRSTDRYLKRIKYGNRVSHLVDAVASQADWMFEVVFDYGEHDQDEPRPNDESEWLCRHDPFSSYRSGFEVRTYRLCQRVLMFHHFPDQATVGRDCLVRSTELIYRNIRGNAEDHRKGHPVLSFIASVAQSGYERRPDGGYIKKSMPPLEFDYSGPEIHQEVRDIDPDSLENLPYGVDGSHYRWVDLDGEGMPGLLTAQSDAWFYKRNLSPSNTPNETGHSGARFGPAECVSLQPNTTLGDQGTQFLDLAGDGQPDLVVMDRPMPGFYERTDDRSWSSFRAFRSWPTFNPRDPNLRFIDLDGDGHVDALISEHEVFTWFPSLGEEGFGPARRVQKELEEQKGPTLVFADGTQSIFLADMSGDGLTDLVRIQNGDVSYWPNLGYGRFGAKVTMDDAPWFDERDQFDHRRLRLADIDGSGINDIIYLGRDGVRLYFNQSGNSWSASQALNQFPPVDNLTAVTAVDLLGNGTACLVWSSPLTGDTGRPMRYIDLMGGQKPHLLTSMKNNLGAETRVAYAPSTRFYLADKAAGKPWITRLPFPVHVVEQTETFDRISRNRFVTRYAYHHGFYDGVEREFRGFGLVEQQDTEEFAALRTTSEVPAATNIDEASHVPPGLTRTWFHTGAYLRHGRISLQFKDEYFPEPGLTDAELEAWLLPDTILPAGLTAEEERQACRALKGAVLRQEVYALDGSIEARRPYLVTERNYAIRQLQPQGDNRDVVLLSHSRETIDFHYERAVFEIDGVERADPRVRHVFTLAVDEFGDVLESVAVAYGRRHDGDDPLLTDADREKQRRTLITHTENLYTNPVLVQGSLPAQDAHRAPLPAETRTYELRITPPSGQVGPTVPFRFEEMRAAVEASGDGQHDLPYEDLNAVGAVADVPHRRMIEHVRTLYRRDDLAGPLPLGQVESMALTFERYRLAFTQSLVEHVYGARVDDSVLANEGRYVHLDGDTNWWIPSGQVFHSVDPGDAAAEELAFAREHFFLIRRFEDPFGGISTLEYDTQDLLLTRVTDPLGNRIESRNDYRVLHPHLVTDPNGNRTEAAFDALGMIVGTAVMGKANGDSDGDSLADFVAHLDGTTVEDHIQNPTSDPHAILQRATTRLVYDFFAYSRTQEDPQPQPAVVYTIVRETHDADLAAGEQTRVQHSFSYSDGFGREIQRKIQAEPGAVVAQRWLGSGWTIFNNKGTAVRQYEPFLSRTHEFEFAREEGVSPIVFYDPIGRVVGTLRANHTWDKVVFNPWRQETWDVNDTVLQGDPANDATVGDFFRRLPVAEYLPTWHAQRAAGQFGETAEQQQAEQAAAERASFHANTPTTAYSDNLGRTFLVIAQNRFPHDSNIVEERHRARTELDIEGNQRQVIDADNRIVMRYDYDLLGNAIHSASMEAGERWTLNDAAGQPLRAWDSRGHAFRTEYDALRRPVRAFVQGADPENPNREILFQRTEYGEGALDDVERNLRTRPFRQFDGAGVDTSDLYDFKGNLRRSTRQLATDHRSTPDWSSGPELETEIFETATSYDALNRPVTITMPDDSVIRPTYNEVNLLERLEADLRGAGTATVFVRDIHYNAKGQRELVDYGNGVRTTYTYDRSTFRLTGIRTLRGPQRLQDLMYTYDAVGNITTIHDNAHQTIYFDNEVVEPHSDYTYDSLYRLIEATGREHIGQLSQPEITWNDEFRVNLPHPHDGQAMRRYTERYAYDVVGNFLELVHQAAEGNWTRRYAYDEASLIEPDRSSNRLSRTTIGSTSETYLHDAHGNMSRMPHVPRIEWDFEDRMREADLEGGGTVFFAYDAAGKRVRKVREHNGSAVDQCIYLGGFEIFRRRRNDAVEIERETLHVMDGTSRLVLVETLTVHDTTLVDDPLPRERYQLANHLGTVALELDDDGAVISYEEFHPYGSSAYHASNTVIEVSRKRYRYTGKERDEETGLHHMEERYYAPWLGRWTAADPIGLRDGPNRYVYVRGNPVVLRDPSGKFATSQETPDADEPRRVVVRSNRRETLDAREREISNAAAAVSTARAENRKELAKELGPEGFANQNYDRDRVEVLLSTAQNISYAEREIKTLRAELERDRAEFEKDRAAAGRIARWGRPLEITSGIVLGATALAFALPLIVAAGKSAFAASPGAFIFAQRVGSEIAQGEGGTLPSASVARQAARLVVQLDAATGLPKQLSGSPVGPAYKTFEEAFEKGKHVVEVIVRKHGKEVAKWWEASETGAGFAGHTEQKALSRINLGPGVEVEIRGWFPACPYHRGCLNAMEDAARLSGAEITYRTPRQIYQFPEEG